MDAFGLSDTGAENFKESDVGVVRVRVPGDGKGGNRGEDFDSLFDILLRAERKEKEGVTSAKTGERIDTGEELFELQMGALAEELEC